MNAEQNKLGRPLADATPASGHIHLRVTMERKNAYVRAARKNLQTLSEWIQAECDYAVERQERAEQVV